MESPEKKIQNPNDGDMPWKLIFSYLGIVAIICALAALLNSSEGSQAAPARAEVVASPAGH